MLDEFKKKSLQIFQIKITVTIVNRDFSVENGQILSRDQRIQHPFVKEFQ